MLWNSDVSVWSPFAKSSNAGFIASSAFCFGNKDAFHKVTDIRIAFSSPSVPSTAFVSGSANSRTTSDNFLSETYPSGCCACMFPRNLERTCAFLFTDFLRFFASLLFSFLYFYSFVYSQRSHCWLCWKLNGKLERRAVQGRRKARNFPASVLSFREACSWIIQ